MQELRWPGPQDLVETDEIEATGMVKVEQSDDVSPSINTLPGPRSVLEIPIIIQYTHNNQFISEYF